MKEMKHDNSKPNDIRIDRDGVWYFRGAEMIRMDIVRLFYEHLKEDEAGRFIIELENDRSEVEVEDAPYTVRSVTRTFDPEGVVASYLLLLNDETVETLTPETLCIGKENVLYCRVRGGLFEAKFTRAAYYQIAHCMEYDSGHDLFYLVQKGRKHPVASKDRAS